jgi:cysteine dioxygenase
MRTTSSLEGLFHGLDASTDAVPLDELCARMRDAALSLDDVRDWVRFGDGCYRRNLVRLGPGYVALVLCWRPGQASPVHDHRGSACALQVLSGTATERRYRRHPDGRLELSATNRYAQGEICGTYDADIHTMVNEDPASDLVTLHVYTPPMRSYHAYSLDSDEVRVCADQEVLAEERRRGLVAAAGERVGS